MFPGLRSSETKYTSLDVRNSETRPLYRHATDSITLFWREVVIFFLAVVCAILALEHVYYPVDVTRSRATVPEYRELQSYLGSL